MVGKVSAALTASCSQNTPSAVDLLPIVYSAAVRLILYNPEYVIRYQVCRTKEERNSVWFRYRKIET